MLQAIAIEPGYPLYVEDNSLLLKTPYILGPEALELKLS